jgi:DNA-binding transcriptional LysR family regulator
MARQIPTHQMIEAFRAAVMNGGISVAADALETSQSSVSRLIADLQKVVGFQLFVKHGRTVKPTEEALALMGKVQQSFLGLEDIARFSEQLRKQRMGRVSIAAIPALGHSIMPDAMKFLRGKYPDVVVSLDIASSIEVVRSVSNRKTDIGFAAHRLALGEVEYLAEFTADCVCIAAPGALQGGGEFMTLQDLAGRPFVALTGAIQKRLEASMGELGVDLHVVAEASQSLTASELAMRGIGLAVVDPFTAVLHRARGGTSLPLRPSLPFGVQVMALGDTVLSPPAKDLLQYMATAAANAQTSGH